MRVHRLVAALATTAAVLAITTPVDAVSTTTARTWNNHLDVEVVDCALSVAPGTTCHWFHLVAVDEQELTGTTTLEFRGKGGLAKKQDDGTFLIAKLSETTTSGTGTLRSTKLGQVGKLSMTIDLACDDPGCAVAGSFTFRLTALSRRHGAHRYQTIAQTMRQNDCRYRVTGYLAEITRFAGSGTVTTDGSLSTLRVMTAAPSNVFSSSDVVVKYPAACTLP